MAHELALSHYSRPWLGLIATKAKLPPHPQWSTLAAAPDPGEPTSPHHHPASALARGAMATALTHQCRRLAHHEPAGG